MQESRRHGSSRSKLAGIDFGSLMVLGSPSFADLQRAHQNGTAFEGGRGGTFFGGAPNGVPVGTGAPAGRGSAGSLLARSVK